MQKNTLAVRIFNFVEPLDAFVVTEEYQRLAKELGLAEWNPVVWIGRFFILDNDFGEHWFDNWEEREGRDARVADYGLESGDLMIIRPERFMDGKDGPCHTDEMRKRFWTDVLKSLELSYDLMFDEARLMNESIKEFLPEEYMEDLEERIRNIRSSIVESE